MKDASHLYTVDFARSFLTFRVDTTKKPPRTASHQPPYSLNNARIQLECRCQITERRTGNVETFVLGASCKTERVGVDRDIWLQPNADFAPIFSQTRFMHLKTYVRAGVDVELYPPGSGRQSDRQSGNIEDAFDRVSVNVTEAAGRVLPAARDIVEAALANQRLVARTEFASDRYTVVLEHPVKTINANERDWIYQTDTGPVLFPDLEYEPDELLERLELAYAAFNCPTWTEFIVRIPTPASDDVEVQHYSRAVRVEAKNQIISLD